MSEANALLTVRPATGRTVVTPQGERVPTSGFQIDLRDPWWARALTSGDIVELNAPDTTSKPAATPTADGAGRSEEKK